MSLSSVERKKPSLSKLKRNVLRKKTFFTEKITWRNWLDGYIENKKEEKRDDKEIEIIKTVEQREEHSDFIRKYVLGSVVDKFTYEMVCYKCNKNFTKEPHFKKHIQEIFCDL